jgi:valyl-tRNA synthetase
MKIKQVMITGLLNTNTGDKMSKSQNNGLDANDMHKKWGSDAIRYWAASCPVGHDVEWDEKILVEGRNFLTKIKNAKICLDKYCDMCDAWADPHDGGFYHPSEHHEIFHDCDHYYVFLEPFWEFMGAGQLHKAFHLARDFFSNVFCSKVLERAKPIQPNGTESAKHLNECYVVWSCAAHQYMQLSNALSIFLPKTCERYSFKDLDHQWYERKQVYKEGDCPYIAGESYNINTPPPTVSGNLHMGHILGYVQMDFMARYKRLQGYNVNFPLGFDTNGVNTAKLIASGLMAPHNGDGEPCGAVYEWQEHYRDVFYSYNISYDLSRYYSTGGMFCSDLAHEVFNALDRAGLIKMRGKLCDGVMQHDCVIKLTNDEGEYEQDIVDSIESVEWLDDLHKNKLKEWMRSPQDWTITRGGNNGPVSAYTLYVPGEYLRENPNYTSDAKLPLSTWFISALTPLITKTPQIDLMPLGHDIITSWLYYTLVMQALLERIGYDG